MKNIDVIEYKRKPDIRYVVIDKDTGKVLDDAQGYGYKTKQNAYRAWTYKNRDKSKDKEREKMKKIVQKWCNSNKSFCDDILDDMWYATKYGDTDEKFGIAYYRNKFEQFGYTDLPFTIKEFMKYSES